jgi:chemotaxis response regulator CheB
VIYQVFKSGAIEPICNALNKTTALTVRAVGSDIDLLPGSAYVIPCGLRAAVEQSHGKLALSIDATAAEDRGTDPFVRFLISACKVYGDRLSLALVGGMGEFVERMIPGLEAVSESGGEISFVREPGSAPMPESDKSRGRNVAIGLLSADELVARLYSYSGLTGSVRHPI